MRIFLPIFYHKRLFGKPTKAALKRQITSAIIIATRYRWRIQIIILTIVVVGQSELFKWIVAAPSEIAVEISHILFFYFDYLTAVRTREMFDLSIVSAVSQLKCIKY